MSWVNVIDGDLSVRGCSLLMADSLDKNNNLPGDGYDNSEEMVVRRDVERKHSKKFSSLMIKDYSQ